MFELANVAGSGSPWRRYPEDFGALKPKLFKWQNIIKHCRRRTITVIWLGYNWAIYRTGMKEINSTRKHSSIWMKPKWQMLNAEMGLKAQHITIKCTCLSNSQHCVNNCVGDEDLAASFFIYHNWHHILGCRLCLVNMRCVYNVFLRPGFLLKNMNVLLTRLWSTLSKGLLGFLLSAARVVRQAEVFLQIQQHSHKSKTQLQRGAVYQILDLGGQSLLTLADTVLENSSSNPERNQGSWVVGCASLMFGSLNSIKPSFHVHARVWKPWCKPFLFLNFLCRQQFHILRIDVPKSSVGG